MAYRNAEELLPRRLLRELQKYASGEVLYVPSADNKAGWGEKNGSRAKYDERNSEIRAMYRHGAAVTEIADVYCLSGETVRKIIYSRVCQSFSKEAID